MKAILISVLAVIFIFLIFAFVLSKKVATKDVVKQKIQGLGTQDSEESSRSQAQWRLQRQAGVNQEPEVRKKKNRSMEQTPFVERVLVPLRKNIEEWLLSFTPTSMFDYLSKKMIQAGHHGKGMVGPFLLKVAVFTVLMAGLMLWAVSGSDIAAMQKIAYFLLGGAIGFILPFSSLRRQVQQRQDNIRRQLPEALDILCVSVEAGLSFDAALAKISTRMKGPFIDECKRMLDDVRMGATRRTALQALAERCDVQEVSLFVTSIIQAERLGSNMSKTLKIQADAVRERHRQWVKAMALKAPVKIVLPLVGLILPAIFIVALGPAIFNIMTIMK